MKSGTPTPRITHIALHVSDLDKCIEFYRTFCQMEVMHRRLAGSQRIVWMAEAGRSRDFIFVMMEGGRDINLPGNDYRHFGFATDNREAVDNIADMARDKDCLVWPPRQEAYPVGYYCGLRDPNGNYVEFSYGQPLGPGSENFDDLEN